MILPPLDIAVSLAKSWCPPFTVSSRNCLCQCPLLERVVWEDSKFNWRIYSSVKWIKLFPDVYLWDSQKRKKKQTIDLQEEEERVTLALPGVWLSNFISRRIPFWQDPRLHHIHVLSFLVISAHWEFLSNKQRALLTVSVKMKANQLQMYCFPRVQMDSAF